MVRYIEEFSEIDKVGFKVAGLIKTGESIEFTK